MDRERQIVTAREMDAMTPAERAASVRSGIVRDLGELAPAFRARVESRARELAAELGLA